MANQFLILNIHFSSREKASLLLVAEVLPLSGEFAPLISP